MKRKTAWLLSTMVFLLGTRVAHAYRFLACVRSRQRRDFIQPALAGPVWHAHSSGKTEGDRDILLLDVGQFSKSREGPI